MRIGIECFQDVQLRSIIESENQIGHCDIRDMDNIPIYDTEKSQNNDLEANIVSIISLYVPGNEMENVNRQRFDRIENMLREDWKIFSPALQTEQIRRIILAICKNEYTENDSIFQGLVGLGVFGDSQFLRDNCLTRDESWIDFSQGLKHKQRFHKHLNLEVLQQLLNSETLHLEIEPGTELYRSRISNGEMYAKNQMGTPPPDRASEGRVNSKGIPCLYLADTVETTLHEIRARDFDDVTVATFTPTRKVNLGDLRQLDQLSPFAAGIGLDWYAVNVKILHEISLDIAKPMRRNDSVLDYLPSQYIADFVKSLGYDGICFFSTLNRDHHGVNYAFFNEKDFQCMDVKMIRVMNLEFHIKNV